MQHNVQRVSHGAYIKYDMITNLQVYNRSTTSRDTESLLGPHAYVTCRTRPFADS